MSRYKRVRQTRESACEMLSNASAAKWPTVWTCGSWRCPQAAQYSPASGWPQFAHTSVSGAGGSGGLTTVTEGAASGFAGTGRSLIGSLGDVGARGGRGRGLGGGLGRELVRIEIVDADEIHHLAVVVAQHRGFGLGDDSHGERLRDLPGHIECGDLAGLHAFDPDAFLDRFRRLGHDERLVQQPERIARLERAIDETAQPVAYLGRVQDGVRDRATEPVARRGIRAPAREDQHAHDAAEEAVREVAQEVVQLLLRLVHLVAARPFDDRQILDRPALVLV